jgi:hypothetical protein
MRASILAFALLLFTARADVLNLANGDRFVGSIELVNAAEVHLKSETLGLVKIPRAKVASIYFGTNQPPTVTSSVKKQSAIDPESVEKVQQDFLANAGPEANDMFKELVQGLASGKLNAEDIRNQARQSLAELKDLQDDLGDEADNALIKSYVGILERFIAQGTNRAETPAPKPIPSPTKPDAE